jgi:hypothetical protein
MKATVTILETNFDVEYDFDITASGCGESWSAYGGDPAEPAEFDLTILSIAVPNQHADVTLELPTWLHDLIANHLYERDDINEIVQRADQERGMDDPDYL